MVIVRSEDDELLVLDPDWFGSDVLGRVLSPQVISESLPHDGRATLDQLRAVLACSQPQDMARLLAAAYLCVPPLHGRQDIVLPCHDRSDEPTSLQVRGVEDKVNTHTHTHTHTNTHSVHATRDIASDRRHLALCAGSAAQKSTNLKIARTGAVGSRLRTCPPQGWRGESVRYVISAAEVTWVRCLLVCRRRHRAMPLKLLHVR